MVCRPVRLRGRSSTSSDPPATAGGHVIHLGRGALTMNAATTSFMRASDTFAWHQEDDPVMRATIVGVLWLDRRPDWDLLRRRLGDAVERIPRLRQRIVETPVPLTPPRWVLDPDFDLSWHLRRVDAPGEHTPEDVLELARVEAMSAFDLSRPLWQFTLVEHVQGGTAALIMKLHHALTDGKGATVLASAFLDDRRTPAPRAARPAATEQAATEQADDASLLPSVLAFHWNNAMDAFASGLRGVGPLAVGLVRDPLGAVRSGVRTARSIGRTVAPVVETMSPVMRGRGRGRALRVVTVDLADLRAAAACAQATVNDAFLTAVTGGLRRYHARHDSTVEAARVTMPVSIRVPTDPPASNRITLLRLTVPVAQPGTFLRLRQIHQICARARTARSLPFTDLLAGGLGLLPVAVTGGMLKHVDILASDVTGVPGTVYLAGAKVTAMAAFGPTLGCAVNITLLSHKGRCHVGLNLDTAAVPDPDVFTACLAEGFDEVVALTEAG